jgi:hypothetical protein
MSQLKNPELKKNNPLAGLFASENILTISILYFVSLLVVFAPVIFKPMDTPDTMSQLYAAYFFNREYFLSHFSLPFWMPFLAGGTPWVEGSNFNHLFDFICFLFPLQLGIGYRIILFVLMAGIFACLFFRSVGLSHPVAFIAGLAYMLSGDAISYAMLGHFGKTVNMTFLPLVLLFLNHGFKSGRLIHFLFAGLPVAFLFKGHPQVFYYNMMFITLYFICRMLFEMYDAVRKQGGSLPVENRKPMSIFLVSIAGFALMGIVAVILSSDNLLHHYMMLKLTSRGAEMDAAQKWQFAISWSLHPLELLGYFIPSIYGLQGQTYMGWRPFVSTSDYVGIAPLFIALFGIVMGWRKRHVKLFTVITLAAVLYGFGGFFEPYFRFFYETLPFIKSFRVPSTIYILVAFFLVYLFAVGLKFLVSTDWKKPENRKKGFIFLASIVGVALLLTLYMNSPLYSAHLKSGLASKVDLDSYYAKYSASQVDAFVAQATGPAKEMGFAGLRKFWILTLIFVLILYLFFKGRMKAGAFLFALGLFLFVDLTLLDKSFVRSTESYDFITEETPEIRFLKQDKDRFRIIPFPPQNDLEVGKWPVHKLESAYAYNAAGLKLFDEVHHAGLLFDPKFLGLFNVKYLVSAQNFQDPRVEKVFSGKKNVYLNKLCLPRVTFADKYIVIPKQEEILAYMKRPEFDPSKEIILEKDPGVSGLSVKGNSYETIQWDYDRIELKVKMENPGFLFLSEVYFPKWKAVVDGKEREIFRTSYLFRSIYLERGEHTVLFFYDDGGIYAVHTIGVLILTVGFIILILRRRKIDFKKDDPQG